MNNEQGWLRSAMLVFYSIRIEVFDIIFAKICNFENFILKNLYEEMVRKHSYLLIYFGLFFSHGLKYQDFSVNLPRQIIM